MFKLSAIVITLNEEKNIARCIASLKKVADEILIVDSYSTDRTKKICGESGVRFIENSWPGYSAQKNFAQSVAVYDCILCLDADEELSDELIDSIQEAKSGPGNHVFEFNRLTNYCGHWIKHGGWHPDYKVRMYNRQECRWDGIIHEKLIIPEGKKIYRLKGYCYHYSFYTIEQHLRQVNTFTSLMAEEAVSSGKRSSFFQVIFSPCFRFIRDYFFKTGFLDGYFGLVVCAISSYAVFIKHIKIRQRIKPV